MAPQTKIDYEIKRLDLKYRWTISRASINFKNSVFVQIEREGISGYGEASPNSRYEESAESTVALIEKAIPLFEHRDLRNYYDLGREIQALDPAQTAGKAALDIALMDWVAKSVDVPLYRYFGLDKQKAPLTSYSIGIDTPEMIHHKIAEAPTFPVLKIKLGGSNDREIIEAVRSATDKPIRVDANEGWKDRREALEKIRWLQTVGVEFVEQPMPSHMLEETAWLRERVELPLIADESVKTAADIPRLAGVFDGINIKLMKSGGIQEALRMIWLAKSLNMKIMLGCMIESSLAISAAAALSPLVDYADLDGHLLLKNDPYRGVMVQEGRLILSDLPGIGVEPFR